MGLTVLSVGDHMVNGSMRTSWRVYAVCTDPGDFVTAVCGAPSVGPMVLQTTSSNGVPSGGNFVNVFVPGPFGGATAPTAAGIAANPELEWDTFTTIGLAVVPDGVNDQTGLAPGWFGIGDVAQVNGDNIGNFTAGPVPQAMAGNGVANIDGMGNWGLIVFQLTVNAGNHVRGTVAVNGYNNAPLAGTTTFFVGGQTFNSFPAPGGLALLGVAAVAGRSRKRRN